MLLAAGEILREKQYEYPLFPIPFSGSVGWVLTRLPASFISDCPNRQIRRKGQIMRFKKTRWDRRGTYTFDFNDGTRITLKPGEDGITEAEHPGETYPANWNLSLDYMAGEDGDDDKLDKSEVSAAASTEMDYEDESEEEMVERILDFLSPVQRKVYYLRYIKGYKGKEVAEMLNTSTANVSQRYKEALAKIEEKKENM